MARLVIIQGNAQILGRPACLTQLPEGFEVPSGCLLSWNDTIACCLPDKPPMVSLEFGTAKAIAIRDVSGFWYELRIEGPKAEDLFHLVGLATVYFGGKAVLMSDACFSAQSAVRGIRNDAVRLFFWVKRQVQKIGRKLMAIR